MRPFVAKALIGLSCLILFTLASCATPASGGWTPAQAAAAVAQAAAEAANQPNASREGVIDAATQAAIDQALLVAPQVVDAEWVGAIRQAIRLAVVLSKSPDPSEGVRVRVEAITLEALQ